MGFSKPKYGSGVPFSSPGDLPDPGIEPGSPALQADSSPFEPPKKKKKTIRKPRAYLWHTGSLVFCHHKRGPMYPSFAQNLHSFKAQASKSWKISQSQNHSITLVGWSFLLPHHAQAMEMLSFISSCLNGGLICSQMFQDGERQGESTGLDRQLWFHLHCQRKEQHDGLQNWTWRLDFLQVSLAPM